MVASAKATFVGQKGGKRGETGENGGKWGENGGKWAGGWKDMGGGGGGGRNHLAHFVP